MSQVNVSSTSNHCLYCDTSLCYYINIDSHLSICAEYKAGISRDKKIFVKCLYCRHYTVSCDMSKHEEKCIAKKYIDDVNNAVAKEKEQNLEYESFASQAVNSDEADKIKNVLKRQRDKIEELEQKNAELTQQAKRQKLNDTRAQKLNDTDSASNDTQTQTNIIDVPSVTLLQANRKLFKAQRHRR